MQTPAGVGFQSSTMRDIGVKLLIKRFVKNHEDVGNPDVRAAYGKLSSIVGIVCNLLLFVGKLAAGTISGSVSITADAVNNLSDASSSIISLLGFKMSAKPADKEHPYGHGRYEYLSGLMVAVLIIVIGVELFQSSLGKIINPAPVAFSWVAIGVLAASILLKCWMMVFNRQIGKTIGSKTLFATAADSRNDVVTTAAVLAAALISHYTGVELDGWMGLVVALFILVSGFGLIRDTLDPLLGRAPDDEEVNRIRSKIMSYPGVLGTHDLLVHDYGPGRRFASVHVEMAAEEDALESHDVIDQIERDFLKEGLNMLVHYDPIITEEGKTGDLRRWLEQTVAKVNPKMTIHDLRVVSGRAHTKLVFDCLLPADVPLGDREVASAVEHAVKAERPDCDCVITVDRSFAAIPKGRAEEIDD